MKSASILDLLRKVDEDEDGAVSLETILVVALIALPVLIFLYKVGWPRIKQFFSEGLDQLEEGQDEFTEESIETQPRLMLATLLLFAFGAFAAYTDFRWHKIYNWTTYPGILSALTLGAVADALAAQDMAANWLSEISFLDSLFGFLACGGVMLVCFVFFSIGGGDVKLIAMIGAFLGPYAGIEVLLWTFVVGAAAAVIGLIWKVGTLNILRRFIQYLAAAIRMRGFGHLKGSIDEQYRTSLFLAPSALVAVVIVKCRVLETMGLKGVI